VGTGTQVRLLTLTELIADIKTNMSSFIVVGQNLKMLHEGGFKGGLKKFMSEHEGESMSSFIEKKLGITRVHAYRPILESDIALYLQNVTESVTFTPYALEPLISVRLPKTEKEKRPGLDFETYQENLASSFRVYQGGVQGGSHRKDRHESCIVD
jgi:hypothetical protein